MIHPNITVIFPDNDEAVSLFSWICNKIKQVDGLEEFVKWHLDVNKEVIKEITHTQNIDFSNDVDARKWAKDFLDVYEEKIRKMRHISNRVFERFHRLKEEKFEKIISENKDYEKKMIEMMQIFLNRKELLIGKIIFAYRETWFLANQICDPDFKLGSVEKYKEWVDTNLSNLKEIDQSLENIHSEISKWKR